MISMSVVAFMVTVKLVEKSVKRRVGMLMVVILSAKYSMVEIKCRIARMSLPSSPIHEDDFVAATTSSALAAADDRAVLCASPIMVEMLCKRVSLSVVAFEGSILSPEAPSSTSHVARGYGAVAPVSTSDAVVQSAWLKEA